jgi:hypothetical protein
MKTHEAVELYLHHSSPRYQMEVGHQLQGPAFYSQRKTPGTGWVSEPVQPVVHHYTDRAIWRNEYLSHQLLFVLRDSAGVRKNCSVWLFFRTICFLLSQRVLVARCLVVFCVANSVFIKATLTHKARRVKYGVFQDKWEMLHFVSEGKDNLLCLICQQLAFVKITAQDREGLGFLLNSSGPAPNKIHVLLGRSCLLNIVTCIGDYRRGLDFWIDLLTIYRS